MAENKQQVIDEIENRWVEELKALGEEGVDAYAKLVDLAWAIRYDLVQTRHREEDLKQTIQAVLTLLLPGDVDPTDAFELKQRAKRMYEEALRKKDR